MFRIAIVIVTRINSLVIFRLCFECCLYINNSSSHYTGNTRGTITAAALSISSGVFAWWDTKFWGSDIAPGSNICLRVYLFALAYICRFLATGLTTFRVQQGIYNIHKLKTKLELEETRQPISWKYEKAECRLSITNLGMKILFHHLWRKTIRHLPIQYASVD
jgi:hypothetical protein